MNIIEQAGRAFCDVVVCAIHDKVRARGGSASLSGSEYYMYPPAIEAFNEAIEAALNVAILAERQRCAEVARNATIRYEMDWRGEVETPVPHRDSIAQAILAPVAP